MKQEMAQSLEYKVALFAYLVIPIHINMAAPDQFKVFRKAAPNDKMSVYLFTRDYIDNAGSPPKIEGVFVVDPNYVADRKAYIQMALIFGRKDGPKDEDVCNMEVSFTTKTLHVNCHQVYPVTDAVQKSGKQEELIGKLGQHAFPFNLEFPTLGGPSYQMLQGSKDEHGSNLGLEYEVQGFVGSDECDEHKRSTAKIAVWRIQALPPALNFEGAKPKGHMNRAFVMYSGDVNINILLNKSLYKTNDEITVFADISNTCNREITNIKVKLCQRNQIPMFTNDGCFDVTIQKVEDKVHIQQGGKMTRDYTLCLVVPPKKAYGRVMLEGTVGRDGEESLASTTHINQQIQRRDIYGVFVEYVVKVKVTFGTLPGDGTCEAMFTLTQK